MVVIRPFPGFRPPQHLAGALAAPPYDVLDTNEARVMAEGNEHSFLHVNKPEIDLDPSIDLYDDRVYAKGVENLTKFVANGWLVQDTEPNLYVYAQKMGEHIQYGIVGGASVNEYETNIIKKHELTRKKKEEDRTRLTMEQNANVGPVFLTYRAREDIDATINSIITETPTFDFTAQDGIGHKLWVIPAEKRDQIVEAFKEVPVLYIADGHHRAASAYNVGKIKRENAIKEGLKVTGDEEFNFFMAVYFPSNQLRIMDYNRVVKDLNGLEVADFLTKVGEKFEVVEVEAEADPKPTKRHELSMYIADKWYKLHPRDAVVDESDPVKSLDVEVLTDNILAPLLAIGDLRSDDRIDFIGGIRGLSALKQRVKSGWAVAFAVYPVSLDELMRIADAGQIMPPKSTWFEPKLRSGVVVRIMDK